MNYCGRCGADMHRASRLQHALRTGEDSQHRLSRRSPSESDVGPPSARRSSDYEEDRDPWLGQIVDNRYRVVEVIGRGGMGVVYKVEHQRMSKIAAMKVLHHDLASDREVIRRFQREAEAVSRLNHPNTVQVFDFGMAGGQLYLVMEYVSGLDIGALIDRDGPIEFSRAAPLFAQICAALAEAHDLGVVHRDLKPENILVTRTHGGNDFVKVLDFGLAKLSEREELAEVTGRGSIVGTPYYMSPEQIRGEHIDARADIYSLGSLMYRVVTGEHCFSAKTPVGVLTKHLTEPAVPPATRRPDLGISERVDELIMRALEKRPAERHQTVRELLDDLEDAFADEVDEGSSARRRLNWAHTGSGPSHTPRNLADEIDYGIESNLRLRRADLDQFERSLKRRKWLRVVGVPLFLAAGGAGAFYWFAIHSAGPHEAEREPNDHIDRATLIAANTAVTGKLGQRISKTESDRDFFRLDQEPDRNGGTTVSAHVAGLPNMDIDVYVYTIDGKLIARANEGGVGQEEWIRRYRTTKPVTVLVTEAKEPGTLPTENVSDWYTLTVRLAPADPRLETEPNDSSSDACPLSPGTPVTGHLDRRVDVDHYRFDGPDGTYSFALSSTKDTPILWRLDGSEPRKDRKATVELKTGSIIKIERADRASKGALPGANDPYTLDVTEP